MSTGNVIQIKKEDKIITCGYSIPVRVEEDVNDAGQFVVSKET